MQRVMFDLKIGSSLTTTSTTLTGVFGSANTDWMLLGISIGWVGDANKSRYELWGYF